MNIEPVLTPNITFSDNVICEQGTNKFSLIGTFHQFITPQFPFQPLPFFVTVTVSNITGPVDAKVAVRLEDKSSGYVVASAAGEMRAGPDLKSKTVSQWVFRLTGVFPAAGEYSLTVLVDSRAFASRDLPVILTTDLPTAPTVDAPAPAG
jgi:hypothetical protein